MYGYKNAKLSQIAELSNFCVDSHCGAGVHHGPALAAGYRPWIAGFHRETFCLFSPRTNVVADTVWPQVPSVGTTERKQTTDCGGQGITGSQTFGDGIPGGEYLTNDA